MKLVATGLVVLGAALVCLSRPTLAQGDKALKIKDVMKKIGDGSTGYFYKLGRELRDADPRWDDARRFSKEMARLTAPLPKCTPPKGDKASWDKKVKAFVENTKALDEAVATRDLAKAQAAFKKVGEAACMACHEVHRKE